MLSFTKWKKYVFFSFVFSVENETIAWTKIKLKCKNDFQVNVTMYFHCILSFEITKVHILNLIFSSNKSKKKKKKSKYSILLETDITLSSCAYNIKLFSIKGRIFGKQNVFINAKSSNNRMYEVWLFENIQ